MLTLKEVIIPSGRNKILGQVIFNPQTCQFVTADIGHQILPYTQGLFFFFFSAQEDISQQVLDVNRHH